MSPTTRSPVASEDFRAALRSVLQPTALLTCHDGGDDVVACVVNTVFPVSAAHPSIGVSLQHDSSTQRRMSGQDTFWISFFAQGQDHHARLVASTGADDRGAAVGLAGRTARPVMSNGATAFECDVVERVDAWDHEILLARVVAARVGVEPCLSM